MNHSRKLMSVSSRQLHAFVELCRVQSFVKVSERIHLSPSGLSMLVKELEEQVGARLFDRTTRSLSLTEAGRRLQPVAERIVNELLDVGESIHGTESALHARIDIAATPMISASLLPNIIQGFRRSHPKLSIHLSDVDVATVRSRVSEGEADIGLGFFVKPAVGLLRQPVCRFRLMRVGPASGAVAGRGGVVRSQAWSALVNTNLVGLPNDNPIQALIELHLSAIGKAHENRPQVNLLGTLIGMVEAGIGHAIVPSFALDECLRRGLDVAMLEPAVYLDLFVVSRRGAAAKPAVADFTTVLKQAAARFDPVAVGSARPRAKPVGRTSKPVPPRRGRASR